MFKKIDFKKKILTVAALATVLAPVSSVSAATTKYPTRDSVWVYGQGGKGAFSSYFHGNRYHSASVVSRWTGNGNKQYATAGKTAYATIKTVWGEQVAFYYWY